MTYDILAYYGKTYKELLIITTYICSILLKQWLMYLCQGSTPLNMSSLLYKCLHHYKLHIDKDILKCKKVLYHAIVWCGTTGSSPSWTRYYVVHSEQKKGRNPAISSPVQCEQCSSKEVGILASKSCPLFRYKVILKHFQRELFSHFYFVSSPVV